MCVHVCVGWLGCTCVYMDVVARGKTLVYLKHISLHRIGTIYLKLYLNPRPLHFKYIFINTLFQEIIL